MDIEKIRVRIMSEAYDLADRGDFEGYNAVKVMCGDVLESIAAVVAAEREKVAQWMTRQGYATGHGDSTEDLLKELEWQIEESVRNEREACAKVLFDYAERDDLSDSDESLLKHLFELIRARGQA